MKNIKIFQNSYIKNSRKDIDFLSISQKCFNSYKNLRNFL